MENTIQSMPSLEVQEFMEALHPLICNKDFKCGLIFNCWANRSLESFELERYANELIARGYTLLDLEKAKYILSLKLL